MIWLSFCPFISDLNRSRLRNNLLFHFSSTWIRNNGRLQRNEQEADATWASVSNRVNDVAVSAHTCTACFQHLTHVLDNNSWWLLKNEEVGCCSVTLRFVRGCGSCQEALFIQEEMVVWLLHHSNSAHWLIFLSQCIKMCREPVLRHDGWIARYHGKTCGHNTNMKRDHVHHSSLYKSVWCSKTGPKRGFTVFSFCFIHLK